jgi:galactokinase
VARALGLGLADHSDRRLLIIREFEHYFGGPPKVWVRPPGRVDWMGSHTDYNQGFVLTMSIDRDTWIAARPRADRIVAVYSLNVTGGGHLASTRPNTMQILHGRTTYAA